MTEQMPDESEKRKFKRIKANWVTKIRTKRLSTEELRSIDRIRDVSAGGVFVETKYPFEKGTFIEFEFSIPGYQEPVQAKGIVKWSNDGRIKDQPCGMGIEFAEVSIKAVEKTVQHKLRGMKDITEIVKTPTHENLLRLHDKKSGLTFEVWTVAQYLGANLDEAKKALADFASYGLIRIVDDKITFEPVTDPKLKDMINGYLTMKKEKT